MSLGWKKFSFFDKEERQEAEVPEEATCSTSGGGQLLFGCADGQVVALDRDLKVAQRFQAHQHSVQHCTYLQVSTHPAYAHLLMSRPPIPW